MPATMSTNANSIAICWRVCWCILDTWCAVRSGTLFCWHLFDLGSYKYGRSGRSPKAELPCQSQETTVPDLTALPADVTKTTLDVTNAPVPVWPLAHWMYQLDCCHRGILASNERFYTYTCLYIYIYYLCALEGSGSENSRFTRWSSQINLNESDVSSRRWGGHRWWWTRMSTLNSFSSQL